MHTVSKRVCLITFTLKCIIAVEELFTDTVVEECKVSKLMTPSPWHNTILNQFLLSPTLTLFSLRAILMKSEGF
jgi:hypothetical protein